MSARIDVNMGKTVVRSMRFTGIIALLLATTLVNGCAYYNLFYNAKRAFNEAENLGKDIDPANVPTGAQKSKYRLAIAKSDLVLEEYPESSLVDDALFLKGKSHFRLREYRDALRNIDNVLLNFPQSEFREEALYFKSLAHLSLREEQAALDQFRILRESYPAGRFGVRALFRLGDAYAQSEKYDQAVKYYTQFLDENPNDRERESVILALADVYGKLERDEEAAELLAQVDSGDTSRRGRFNAKFNRVESLRRLGRSDEAAELLADLEGEAEFFNRRAKFLLLSGQLELDRGNEDAGVVILEETADEFSDNGKVIAEAHWILGDYFMKQYGPLDERVEAQFTAAGEERGGGEFMERINGVRRHLESYATLKTRYDLADSTAFDAAFRLGELLLTDLDRPDLAKDYYEETLRLAPDSGLAPKAAYAVGYIASLEAGADSTAFDIVRATYPGSSQALALDGAIFTEAIPKKFVLNEVGELVLEETADGPGAGGATASAGGSPRRTLRRGGPGATGPRDWNAF